MLINSVNVSADVFINDRHRGIGWMSPSEELSEERDRSIRFIDDDAHVLHPFNAHGCEPKDPAIRVGMPPDRCRSNTAIVQHHSPGTECECRRTPTIIS